MESMSDSQVLRLLFQSFNNFAQQTNGRLSMLEQTVSALAVGNNNNNNFTQQQSSSMENKKSDGTHTQINFGNIGNALLSSGNEAASSSSTTPSASASASPSPSQFPTIIPIKNGSHELRGDALPQRWYQNRPFPEFEVSLVDTATGNIVEETRNFQVRVQLFSGNKKNFDQLLGNVPLIFEMDHGRSNIFGAKISAVSSRNGGQFFFKFSLTIPNVGEVTGVSNPFQIVSERLITEKKAISILDLSSTDCLSRVPGIGKKYTTKLSECGYKTVRDLANIDNSSSSKEQRSNLLAFIRKERGSLTETKFNELVRDAKKILEQEKENSSNIGFVQQVKIEEKESAPSFPTLSHNSTQNNNYNNHNNNHHHNNHHNNNLNNTLNHLPMISLEEEHEHQSFKRRKICCDETFQFNEFGFGNNDSVNSFVDSFFNPEEFNDCEDGSSNL